MRNVTLDPGAGGGGGGAVLNICLGREVGHGRSNPDRNLFSDFPIPFKTEFKIVRPFLRHLTPNHTLIKTRMK